ncbi:MAG: hypothetical protein AAFU85_17455 [Planctomycetota bacterium]
MIGPSPNASRILWVVESTSRWCDAARRFVGPFQHIDHDPSTQPIVVRSIELGKVRAAIAGTATTAILWEISSDTLTETALVIAQIGATRSTVLQLAATGDRSTKGLERCLMELGVRGVLRQPEQLATFARLVHRFFDSTGRTKAIASDRP